MKKPLIILTGPTAVGKTELSIQLAKAIDGEIISADSMQVYKDMDIGTAKITINEMQGIKHYLIDELEPEEEFNVVKFKELTVKYMNEIYSKGKIPIIVGGTGFYIQAVLYGIDFKDNGEDTIYRKQLKELYVKEGAASLHQKLDEVDPGSAKAIHPNNVKRVIRALEYYYQTGSRISEHNEEQRQNESPYNFCYIVLNNEREIVYERINKRVDLMIENGLVKEVESLLDKGCTKDMVSMQGLGYKEIISYLEGKFSLEDAVYTLKRDTRHFAKRQLTWFKREKEVIWINKQEYINDENKILEVLLQEIKKKNII
ncbi:tRNA (adenosine(37)-N6)-dimethylallyltransferase MiaA [Anaerocolumna sp. MB42-C2]|uniref:tRNA (adenosine(37)-N6)-dimethylallyltransferase MiaA n=1 Tax=Anaerocolumna sp. MB42-C2 TaxID=3070997 RepID=UPI0027E0B741|nr:tRNA (adenosine(37)-N6)-dimethylallyltransferase MiaA [Anaerocolumna sp. MB42-C2]WMJ88266.1 tRNA (adenosine(37)-N6)-dimethylallyltransferase MiaA [Anaerocolumna sp. MB42-C2]